MVSIYVRLLACLSDRQEHGHCGCVPEQGEGIYQYVEAPPRVPAPYPFIYHFFTERVPSCTPSTDQWYPRFTYLVKNVASPLIAVN